MKIHRLLALALALSLLLTACGGAVPEPGSWKVPWESGSTENEVGMIYFSVSNDSTAITSFNVLPLGWQCGDITLRNDNFFFLSAEDDAYTVSEILPNMVTGDLAVIEDGAFSFSLTMMTFKQSIYELGIGTLTFAGQFSGSKKASGTWMLDLPTSGNTCQGTWNAILNVTADD